MKTPMRYDIIADVHGRFDKLSALMERLGYRRDGESFVPPSGHMALFLGDLIDTKPGHEYPNGVRNTLQAVKAMCDRGYALCIMGNHELNAIFYHSKGPNEQWLKHHGDRNKRTHQGTLNDFPDHKAPNSEWQQVWMPWLKQLPFFLEFDGFRAVHACWHPEMIARLRGRNFDDHDFFLACADKDTPESEAIEIVLKGIEVPLPEGHSFVDHTGTERFQFRARWWETPGDKVHCDKLVFPINDQICAVPVPDDSHSMFQPYHCDEPPVFFGHYFKPYDAEIQPERHNVACLDHSGATGGPIVSYRWQGEVHIKPEHYVTSHEN